MRTSSFHLFLAPTPHLRSGCANMCHGGFFIVRSHMNMENGFSRPDQSDIWNILEMSARRKLGKGNVCAAFPHSLLARRKIFCHWINFLLFGIFEATRRGGKLGHKNYSSSFPRPTTMINISISILLLAANPKDWSDHALWWPAKNIWLTRTRSTLDQCGLHADALLHFTPMHKILRVQVNYLRLLVERD